MKVMEACSRHFFIFRPLCASLKVKEEVNSSDEARYQLAVLSECVKSRDGLFEAQVLPLQQLGLCPSAALYHRDLWRWVTIANAIAFNP